MKRVLFVCLGNICRSPMAQGCFQKLLSEHQLSDAVMTDSAGTGNWHIGRPPDSRAIYEAARRDIHIADFKARQIEKGDFAVFDYILAMDRSNLTDLLIRGERKYHPKIRLLLDFSLACRQAEVPDPYYGASDDAASNDPFVLALDLIADACAGLLRVVQKDACRKNV